MEERTIHLKIKVKSLVDESRSIRKEANKVSGMAKWRLNHHRTTTVREHTRYNLLAYGILRGVPYQVMERKCQVKPSFSKVATIAKRFGASEEAIAGWTDYAEAYLTPQRKVA